MGPHPDLHKARPHCMAMFINFLEDFQTKRTPVSLLSVSVGQSGRLCEHHILRSESPYLGVINWASLVPQTVKNLPAVRETWVQSPSWEDTLEEGMASHPSILV